MISNTKLQTFLSCSFRADDKDVVDFFHTVARALNLDCINVKQGYAETPPDKAKELIQNSRIIQKSTLNKITIG